MQRCAGTLTGVAPIMTGFVHWRARGYNKIHLPCNQAGLLANLLEMSRQYSKDLPLSPASQARSERIGPEGLAALMQAGQEGDQAAYRQLLEQVSGRLRGLVRARARAMDG